MWQRCNIELVKYSKLDTEKCTAAFYGKITLVEIKFGLKFNFREKFLSITRNIVWFTSKNKGPPFGDNSLSPGHSPYGPFTPRGAGKRPSRRPWGTRVPLPELEFMFQIFYKKRNGSRKYNIIFKRVQNNIIFKMVQNTTLKMGEKRQKCS